jgi:hypothetical protein
MLDDNDKREIREIAREMIKEVLVAHIVSCPHGMLLVKSKAWFVGVCIGIGIGAGVGTGGLIAFIMKALN